MTRISIPDLLTTVCVLVDDWYQDYGRHLACPPGKPGPKPVFSDSEVLTLMVSMDFIPYPAETQFIEYIRANHGALFPRLLTASCCLKIEKLSENGFLKTAILAQVYGWC